MIKIQIEIQFQFRNNVLLCWFLNWTESLVIFIWYLCIYNVNHCKKKETEMTWPSIKWDQHKKKLQISIQMYLIKAFWIENGITYMWCYACWNKLAELHLNLKQINQPKFKYLFNGKWRDNKYWKCRWLKKKVIWDFLIYSKNHVTSCYSCLLVFSSLSSSSSFPHGDK